MMGDTSVIEPGTTTAAAVTRAAEPARGARWRLPVGLCGLVALVAAIGFHRLNRRGITHDEAVSVEMARRPLDEFWEVVAEREMNGMLHSLVLRSWMWLGDSLVVLRSLSVLAAIATVVVTFLLGRTLLGTRAAVAASLLLAVHPLLDEQAQNVRPYAFASLLAVVATERLAAAVRRPSTARWVTYSIAGALLVYTHFFGLFVLAGHALAVLLTGRRLVGLRQPALAAAGIGLLLTPVWLFLLTGDHDQLDWIDPLSVQDYRRLAGALSGGQPVLFLGLLAAGLAAAAAAVTAHRARDRRQAWALVLVLCSGVVPAVLPVAISVVNPIVVPRYLFLALPGLALTVGAGLAHVRSRGLAVAGLALALAISTITLRQQHAEADSEQWRQIASYVVDHAQPGDGLILHPGGGRLAFEYHADDAGPFASVLQPAVPSDPWGEYLIGEPPFSRSASEDEIRAATAPFRRLWEVTDGADNAYREEWAEVRATLRRVLGERCEPAGEREFGRYSVALFVCTAG